MNAYEFITGQPWAIRREALDGLLAFAERNPEAVKAAFARMPPVEPESVSTRSGKAMDGTDGRVEIRDGVGIVPVRGVMARYASMFDDVCGGTSYQKLARDLQACADNPAVRAVLLDVNSPGGTVTGCAETAGVIRSLAAKKPVVGYVGGQGCSAAYYLASACTEVVAHPSASLGSIGTVLQIDNRKPKGQVTIVSSQSPLKWADPESSEGRDEYQREVDDHAANFIDDVAANRKTTPEKVQSDFGKGGTMLGKKAVAAGMADATGDYETTLARIARGEFLTPKPGSNPITVPAKGDNEPDSLSTRKTMPKLNPFAVLGRLLASNPTAVQEALVADDSTETRLTALLNNAAVLGPIVESMPPQPNEDAIAARIKAESERLAAEHSSKTVGSFFATQAKSYFAAKVKAGQVLPADVPMLTALYTAMALSDHEGPVAYKDAAGKDATASRLDFLTARFDAKPSNGLTQEAIPADASTLPASLDSLKILPHAATSEEVGKVRSEVVLSMLKQTDAGKAALAANDVKLAK